MPTCENCHSRWRYKETIKKSFTLDPAMICSYCGEKQFQTQKSKVKVAFLTPITFLLWLIVQNVFAIPLAVTISIATIFIVIIILILPLLIELSSTEKYIDFPKTK